MELLDLSKKMELAYREPPSQIVKCEQLISDPQRTYQIEVHKHLPGYVADNTDLMDERVVCFEPVRQILKASKPRNEMPVHVMTVENLAVMGFAGIMVTADNKVIEESTCGVKEPFLSQYNKIDLKSLMHGSKRVPVPQYIDKTVAVLTYPFGSYGHQFAQMFLTIGLFNGLQTDYIYCRYNEMPFMQEAFAYLNIPRERIFPATGFQQLAFKRAHVCLPNLESGDTPLKREFADLLARKHGFENIEPFRKVFFLRNPAQGSVGNPRGVTNLAEVEGHLLRRGFSPIVWAKLSIPEKIRLTKEIKFSVEDYSSSALHYTFFARNAKVLFMLSQQMLDCGYIVNYFPRRFFQENLVGILRGEQTEEQLKAFFSVASYSVDLRKLDAMIDEMEARD